MTHRTSQGDGFYNHLLLKDNVGKGKPTTRQLPNEEFVYGKPEIRDKEGVTESKYHIYIYS